MARLIADLVRRVGAYLVDVALAVGVTAIIAGVISITSTQSLIGSITTASTIVGVIWFIYLTWTQGRGASLGMGMFALRLGDEHAARPIGFIRALVRNVVWFALCAVLIGYITPLFDQAGRRQGWHDRVAGAVVTQRGERTKVLPVLPPRDVRAAEWLAAMSEQNGDTDSISIDLRGRNAAMREGEIISEVPGITADRIEAERLRAQTAAYEAVIDDGDVIDEDIRPQQSSVSAEIDLQGATERISPQAREELNLRRAVVIPELDDEVEATRVVPSRYDADIGGRRAVATLVWDDGSQFRVYTRTVFGRNPQPVVGAQLAAIPDSTMSLSKTHFEIRPLAREGISITDLHSTNGVGVRRRGQSSTLVPGEALTLITGDIVEIGERRARVEVAS